MFTQQERQSSSKLAPASVRRPDVRVFEIGVVVFAALGLALVLTVLEPPRLVDAHDVFATPEVLPEWYLLPAFAIIKAMPSKLIGLIALGGLVGSLFLVPFLPERLPGGVWVARLGFVAIHVAIAVLGWLTTQA
jgi:cytochrome b6-f complex subunit 4